MWQCVMMRDENLLFELKVFKFKLRDRSLSKYGSSRLVLFFAKFKLIPMFQYKITGLVPMFQDLLMRLSHFSFYM